MAIEHFTLFNVDRPELHLGRKTVAAEPAHDDGMAAEESTGRGRILPLGLFVGLAVGAALLYRRSRSTDVSLDDEAEDVEADLAEAQ